MPGMKAGRKSTEFLFALAGLVGGIYLIRTGHPSDGGMLLAASIAAYGISRGVAKINGGSGGAAVALASLLVLGSCAPSQVYIRAERSIYDAVAPEYQRYVEQDAQLADDQKERRVRTVTRWRELIEAAEAQSTVKVTR